MNIINGLTSFINVTYYYQSLKMYLYSERIALSPKKENDSNEHNYEHSCSFMIISIH